MFVVGNDGKEFIVHSDVIAKLSNSLDTLINGPMAEASDGRAIFEDFSKDIFIRLC